MVLERLGAVVAVRLDIASTARRDFELQQSFRGVFEGALRPSAAEVSAVDALALRDLAVAFERRPGDFTPWFRASAIRLGFCSGAER